jgi:hypothetical protein
VRSIVIQLYNCVIQYDGNLKTERYGEVRVVSLSSFIKLYQEFSFEGVQKCGGRDVTESSLVSSRSKGGLAGRRTTTFPNSETKFC